MEIVSATESDRDAFLHWAKQEGWTVPQSELALLRGPLCECAFALRQEGAPLGFVTAVAHGRSGWVGNLIVAPQLRGRGIGSLLLDHALEVLSLAGVEQVWLTASALGRPLYERRGFRAIDGTVRYAAIGRRRQPACQTSAAPTFEDLLAEDQRVWGERRSRLIEGLGRGGELLASGSTRACLQHGTGLHVVGPWFSPDLCPRENRLLLTALLDAVPAGEPIVVDVLESNPLQALLVAGGFERRGRSDLMVRCAAPLPDFRSLVGLASLGSIG